ncbi:MAG: DUF3800 domain-containing protein [Candidatus Sulfotelmatobacter sp.]|jgi:Protein of unknown function (DUF3800)
MVEAYMDESGIHDGAHVCVIAGYWGSEKKWNRFEKRWPAILKGANEPTLREFHSVNFWNSKGERHGVFARWSDTKADKFIANLIACIVETKIFPTSAMLVMEEWGKLNKDERKFLTGGYYNPVLKKWATPGAPNKPYFWPFKFAIANPAIHCKPGLHVHYTFDLNKQFKNHAVNLYALLKNDPKLTVRHRLGALDLECSEKAVGLQAADLLAWQTYQFGKRRLQYTEPKALDEAPIILQKLLTNNRGDDDFPIFDRYGLNVALDNLPQYLRSPGWPKITVLPRIHPV